MKKTGFISGPIFLEHNPGQFHPERPARLQAIESELKKSAIWKTLAHYSPVTSAKDLLLLAHSSELVGYNLKQSGINNFAIDGDTILSSESINVALEAAGSGIFAVDLIYKQNQHSKIFTAVRPPGHHAEKNRSMGFCIFNNISVAAAYAIKKNYVSKVLIIDWDVHHGNGTQDIFYDRDDVFYFSMHQSPLFPGTGFVNETGTGPGKGYTLNIPINAGKGNAEYLKILQHSLSKIEDMFVPDLVLISAGFDAHISDPIGGMNVTDNGFADMTSEVVKFANKHCAGKIISMLEGGYDLNGLAKSVAGHLIALNS